MSKKQKYIPTKKIKRKRMMNLIKSRSIYFSIGSGVTFAALIAKYYPDFLENVDLYKYVSREKIARYLTTRNLNYIDLKTYLLIIGIAMMLLCPLIKNKSGRRNILIFKTIIFSLFSLFFGVFSYLQSKIFLRFFFVSLSFTTTIIVYDMIKIGKNIIAWIAPKGKRSADSGKISVTWGIIWAIIVAIVILRWGVKIG